jgi:hypothetical protein
MKPTWTLPRIGRQPAGTLLGLGFDGGRLEAVLVRRTNGAVAIPPRVHVALSLDPLTHDPDLVGRELRKHLDEAGLRARDTVVCLPTAWALSITVRLPDLPEADLRSLLDLEAERGFPCPPDTLVRAESRYRAPSGESYATLLGVPRQNVLRLEAGLRAAGLRPVSFSLSLAALAGADVPADPAAEGVLVLAPSTSGVGLLVTCGGALAVLRTLEGGVELVNGETQVQAEQVLCETRITLGQLPAELRAAVRHVQVIGRSDDADALTEHLRPRASALGLPIEQLRDLDHQEAGLRLPPATAISAPLRLAVHRLAGRPTPLEFLPPRVSPWQQFRARYATGRFAWAGLAAGAAAVVLLGMFLFQQWQLWRWGSRWAAMQSRVRVLQQVQQQIRTYRPWFDESLRSLSILRRLTEAFPEDGAVSAKAVEIRGVKVTCSGNARDPDALFKAMDQLRAAREVSKVELDSTRGKAPVEFTFNFQWSAERASP